jgi:hypothetical protein
MPSLYFDRKEFIGGKMHFEDRCEGEIVKKVLTPLDKRTRVAIDDPGYVLSKYPKWFHKKKPRTS